MEGAARVVRVQSVVQPMDATDWQEREQADTAILPTFNTIAGDASRLLQAPANRCANDT